jgi:hypothetical protein
MHLNKLKGEDNPMFPKEHLDMFYGNDEINIFDMDDSVKQSYYIFMKEFVTRVSNNWRNYLQRTVDTQETAKLHENVTVSDEAFAWWFLKIRYDRELISSTEMFNEGITPKEFNRRHKQDACKGEHDQKKFGDVYKVIHTKIKELRGNDEIKQFQRNTFFDLAFEAVNKNSVSSKRKGIGLTTVGMDEVAAGFDQQSAAV